MTQQNNLALKKLKGIKPKGVKTKPSYESNLEYLISSGLECVELFGNMLNERGLAFDNVYQTSDKVYEYVDSMNLFSESDLKNLIYNLSVSDLLESYKPKTIFGMYSGALLSKLTKSNQEKGLPTKIHIDGNNQKFDNLFMYAKHVDELVVENFEGGNICREIGSKGTINSLIVRNIKGNCTCLQAAKKGFANFIYVENIEGSNCCQNSAGEGHINLILGTNIEGGNALDKISQKPDSHVEIIIGVNISGSSALSSVASYKGSAGLVLAKNIDGEFVLESSGYSGGSIDLIYADNIAGNQILQKCGYTGNVKELLVSNIVEDPVKERITNLESMNVSTLIQDSSRNHEHFVKKYSLDKIAEIAELMYGKSPDELIKGANLIKKIYEQTKIEMKKPSSRRVYETIKTKKRDYDKIKSMFNQLVDLLKPRK